MWFMLYPYGLSAFHFQVFVKNHDVQAEVEAVTQRMNDLKLDNELKQEKLAQLLDMRAAKIKKLEGSTRLKILYSASANAYNNS